MEKDGSYITKELAIYEGKDGDRKSDPLCKYGTSSTGCTWNSNSLSLDISKTNNYTCQYTKDPEPAIKAASVAVFFRSGTYFSIFHERILLKQIFDLTRCASMKKCYKFFSRFRKNARRRRSFTSRRRCTFERNRDGPLLSGSQRTRIDSRLVSER